ncbi:MAG: succinate dehydrogenase assembly factor 2 [Anaplasmataceae bacterium]|nr:succinate dehydrogenase assembly factor 2 [Anaplasmataceae bacterium]
MTDTDIKKKKLIYRSCYRGCKETDKMLCEFSREQVPLMDENKLNNYEKILDLDDRDIYNMIIYNTKDKDIDYDLISNIKDYLFNKKYG